MPNQKLWMKIPPKPASLKISDGLKLEVQRKADELLESFLKPNFILPPPQDPQWNYVVDIFTKWHQRYFYFCSKYCCPFPNRISEFFESRFAVLIWGSDRDKFEKPPEAMYSGKEVCVTGTIASYQGRPEIVVKEPSQIKTRLSGH